MELAFLGVSVACLVLTLICAASYQAKVRILVEDMKALKLKLVDLESVETDTKIAIEVLKQTTERAYQMASNANIAVAVAQKNAHQPPPAEAILKHELSNLQAQAFMQAQENSFLEPLLSDEELIKLEEYRQRKNRELERALAQGVSV